MLPTLRAILAQLRIISTQTNLKTIHLNGHEYLCWAKQFYKAVEYVHTIILLGDYTDFSLSHVKYLSDNKS